MTNKSKCKCMIHRWLIYYSRSNYTNNQNNYGLENVPFVWKQCCKIRRKIWVFSRKIKTTHDKVLWHKKIAHEQWAYLAKQKSIWGGSSFFTYSRTLYTACALHLNLLFNPVELSVRPTRDDQSISFFAFICSFILTFVRRSFTGSVSIWQIDGMTNGFHNLNINIFFSMNHNE